MILGIILSLLAGVVFLLRGGSPYFQFISKPFGIINPENGKYKTPRWATVVMQLLVITPIALISDLPLWAKLAAIGYYPIGWYLTIAWPWGGFFDCSTWIKRLKMFARMLASIALFLPLSIVSIHDGWIYIGIASFLYKLVFSTLAVLAYSLDTKLHPIRTDLTFNYGEFITGAILAAMTFNLLR